MGSSVAPGQKTTKSLTMYPDYDSLLKVTWTVGVRSYDHSLLKFKVASDITFAKE